MNCNCLLCSTYVKRRLVRFPYVATCPLTGIKRVIFNESQEREWLRDGRNGVIAGLIASAASLLLLWMVL